MNDPEYDKDSERVDFKEFNGKIVVPNDLEQTILRKLKSKNLITTYMQTKIYWIAAAIVAILAFFIGRLTVIENEPTLAQESYLLLLREDSSFTGTDIQTIIKEYTAWSNNLRSKGQLSSAEKLTEQSYSFGSLPPVQGPGVTGFFIIHADNLSEAQKIANSHPHLKYHGGIELMPIDQL